MDSHSSALKRRQQGGTAVEFAIVCALFLALLFGIAEFARLFYMLNTLQEVTRRAAREQVVRWVSQVSTVQREALFGGTTLPAGSEITSADIDLSFHNTLDDAIARTNPISGTTPEANANNCLLGNSSCIRFVRASLGNGAVRYSPMTGWFASILDVPLPQSTVIMPAENLGLP